MHWIVLALDRGDTADLRSATRPAHREYLRRTDLSARFLTGAPIVDDSSGTMCGTWLLLEADTRAAVKAFLAGDPYSQAELFLRTETFALHADHESTWRAITGRVAS